MTKYLDRFAARRSQRRRPFISEWAPPKDNVRPLPGLTCRGCGKRAQVELSSNRLGGPVDYFCYEDLGPFLELFADPRISEWTIVRLP
jgi:hypothetical protein